MSTDFFLDMYTDFSHYHLATLRTRVRGSVENKWCTESCVAKTDIHLGGNMLTKEQVFVLKTYYAARLYHRVKETFHTEFPNSVTTLSSCGS